MSEEQSEQAGHRVVVGVSGRSKSPTALRWGAEQVGLRGGELVAVRAWRPPMPQPGSRGTPAQVTEDLRNAEQHEIAQLAADVEDVLGPGHGAQILLVIGGKRRALVDAGRDADLVVIDAPRRVETASRPAFVSRLVSGAECPVVVVPRSSRRGRGKVAEAGRAIGRTVGKATGVTQP